MQLVTFHNVTITVSVGDTEPASNAYTNLCNSIAAIEGNVAWATDTYSIEYSDEDGAKFCESQSEAQKGYFQRRTKVRNAVAANNSRDALRAIAGEKRWGRVRHAQFQKGFLMAEKTIVKIELPVRRTQKRTGEVRKLALLLETQRGAVGGVESIARTGWVNSEGIFTFAFGRKGDFYKSLLFDARSQVTQAKFDAQHAAVFTTAAIDALKIEVLDFYREVQFDWFTYDLAA